MKMLFIVMILVGQVVLAESQSQIKPQKTPRVPRLGEHRDDVLRQQLGLSQDDIVRLGQVGAFGTARPSASPSKDEKGDVAATLD